MERVECIMITIIIIYYSHHKRACAIMFHYILNLMYLSLSYYLYTIHIDITYLSTNVYFHPHINHWATSEHNQTTHTQCAPNNLLIVRFVRCAYNERRSRVSKCFIKAPFHRVEPLLIA